MKRLLAILAVIFIGLSPIIVLATETIQQPTGYSLDSVEVYHHVVEQNDQLYVISYNITYAILPTTTAQDAWIFQLKNGSTVLGSSPPYAFHTKGYGRGLATIYFPAATAPAWEGAYTTYMIGNPAVSWNGTAPSTNTTSFLNWSTSTSTTITSSALTTRITYLASVLSTAWSDNLTVATDIGTTVFTDDGITYFTNTFPRLTTVCPSLFATISSQPTKDIKTKNVAAATASDNQLIGTPFDMTNIATFLHTSREWATGGVWTLFWLGITTSLVWKLQATRIALFIFGFAMIGGAVTGFMGMLVGIIVGIVGALAIIFAFLWRGSS